MQAQVRVMIRHFTAAWGAERGSNHHLHDLFPVGGPQKQGNRLAGRLGFKDAEALFEVVGKDEFSLRTIEQLLRPAEAPEAEHDAPLIKRSRAGDSSKGGVLVVGVDSLLTNLAKCCRPAPPDRIGGFVTRGRGVAVHRSDCSNFRHMVQAMPERVIPVTWGVPPKAGEAAYPVDVAVEASDRQGLGRLRQSCGFPSCRSCGRSRASH